MIRLEWDTRWPLRRGDTVAYEPPAKLSALSATEIEKQLKQVLGHMADGDMPDFMGTQRIMVTLDKECLKFEEIKDADFYADLGDRYLYRTRES